MARRRMTNVRRKELERLIEDAVVDAYTRDEQEAGFLVALQDNVRLPAAALVVGEEVEVVGFDQRGGDPGVMALCKRKGRKFRVGVTSLVWPSKPPRGAEWIEAYRLWLAGE